MSLAFDEVVETDVVVVGAGVAGISTALGLRGRLRSIILTKERLGRGEASVLAQGGVAAATGPGDSPSQHAADTLKVAGGLADPDAVGVLTADAPHRVRALAKLGVEFETSSGGQMTLGREAGHGHPRIAHAGGDATGRAIMDVLFRAVADEPGVSVAEHTGIDALAVADGHIAGVAARGADGRVVLYLARATVLATGGVGHLYARTTNPAAATGDGIAIAAWAGAELIDLEFVQFHPTVLDVAADPLPLLTEALRGAGATLLDGAGRRFMRDEHPDAELAPRDVVARAIWSRLGSGDGVWLDMTDLPGLAERFPTAVASCRAYGLDASRQPVPVAPAAHYHMGGVAVDIRGRTSLAGLWAVGEAACTGVHGANRLASNSLLEGLVFGARTADDITTTTTWRPRVDDVRIAWGDQGDPAGGTRVGGGVGVGVGGVGLGGAGVPAETATGDAGPTWAATLRQRMWDDVGLVRTEAGLRRTLAWIDSTSSAGAPALTTARLITQAALARPESRGGHYRADHPQPNPHWQQRLVAGIEPALLVAAG